MIKTTGQLQREAERRFEELGVERAKIDVDGISHELAAYIMGSYLDDKPVRAVADLERERGGVWWHALAMFVGVETEPRFVYGNAPTWLMPIEPIYS